MTLSANQFNGVVTSGAIPGNETQAKVLSGKIIEMTGYLWDDAVAGGQPQGCVFVADSTRYPNGLKLLSASVIPAVAVTGDNTDYITFNVNVKTSAGAAVATALTANTTLTGLGSLTALNVYSLTLTGANALVAAGNGVFVQAAKGGAGKAVSGADGKDPCLVTVMAEVL